MGASAHLIFMRLMKFLVLSVLLSLAIWIGLLHWWFEANWTEVPRTAWAMVSSTPGLHWHAYIGMCALVGTLLSAWLFTSVMPQSRMCRGKRHHRGSRVVAPALKILYLTLTSISYGE